MKTYGLYSYSHWQGQGLGACLAYGSKEACEYVANELGSCSFGCYGRPLGGHAVGTCFRVQITHRPRGVQLPDDVQDWNRSDLDDLLDGGDR